MKIVMTLLVRNEEDIIRENIEFHLSQGVSYFIATDNRSIDGTADILREYEAKGVLHCSFEGSDQHIAALFLLTAPFNLSQCALG